MSEEFDSLDPERIDTRNKRRNYQQPAKKRNNLKEEKARHEKVHARFAQKNAAEMERARKAEQAEFEEINKAYLMKLQRKDEYEKKKAHQPIRKEEDKQAFTKELNTITGGEVSSDTSSDRPTQVKAPEPMKSLPKPPETKAKPNKQLQPYLAFLQKTIGNQ